MVERLASTDRRCFLKGLGVGVLVSAFPAFSAQAESTLSLPLPGGPDGRELTNAFPGKGQMILQRTRPPLLETPFEVFDEGVFTPNDRFYVRWHWASIPTVVDADAFRLKVHGHVERALSLSLTKIAALPRFEIAAVNQCSGNSRGLFEPRVPGAQWANGSMGNARWTGVRLKDLLDKAGVKAGAVQVRFNGLDEPVVDDAPDFKKSLDLDHARNGEVMIAYAMNGAQLPLLNGFPLRLVVPGWYSTYWVKMLSDIEVLDKPDEQFWMKTAYRIPDVPGANIKPGETGFKTVPINRMVPRSFLTNLRDGGSVQAGSPVTLRGIAFGGNCGVKSVEFSGDGGTSWFPTELGTDEGMYSFRRFTGSLPALVAGSHAVMVRCTNMNGLVQPSEPVWNTNGFMQNGIETVRFQVA
ncbi:molybdopterin-dependent oxidoreductase [Methylorubrum thiocyanatum]|uniref:DMSO/TMAO reductase YedYZ molybdopterin-dependent catalytic subunit n=1 Tax=Methylorubrum thiocyanatum TaxID=47958 RepID=A0AA40S3X3_9HYPH|nr:molybdopterin-dependent oxidoreductase [Methylorubrum thiocyanatum]MBA8914108.1 DMSO/TMAO reductase YedYZ molybdopterin-dependent catalytic subunit [Methylorubrum thiocyanatum]GJE79073.1 Protein-methionine-sulfoxide reductase catalytic subunit MsrP [Methylorubrum thiocyanatum]